MKGERDVGKGRAGRGLRVRGEGNDNEGLDRKEICIG